MAWVTILDYEIGHTRVIEYSDDITDFPEYLEKELGFKESSMSFMTTDKPHISIIPL
jgi:hypothetical protein